MIWFLEENLSEEYHEGLTKAHSITCPWSKRHCDGLLRSNFLILNSLSINWIYNFLCIFNGLKFYIQDFTFLESRYFEGISDTRIAFNTTRGQVTGYKDQNSKLFFII